MSLMMTTLYCAYMDMELPAIQPYSRFVKFTMDVDYDAAREFWKSQLADAKQASFPPVDKSSSGMNSTGILKKNIEFPRSLNSSITKATVLRAAWALVLAAYSDTEDITFGTTVSGRNAPVHGLESMAGPTVATMPVRVRLDKEASSVASFLKDIQSQASEMSTFEQFGVQSIARVSKDAKEACDFNSLLLVQPGSKAPTSDTSDNDEEPMLAPPKSDKRDSDEIMEGYFHYPLVLQTMLYDEHVELNLTYHSNVIPEERLSALSQHLSHVIQQLLTLQGDEPLSSVSLTSDWDLRQAKAWNDVKQPQLHSSCVTDIVSQEAKAHPEKEALFSSEASLTFSELDKLSGQLASHLAGLGVKPETKVPICFEKSIWAVVAMLGIMKAGGAYVPFDPAHPITRKQGLIEEVGAEHMIVSSSAAESCQGLVPNVVELSSVFLEALGKISTQKHATPSPENSAYVLFTSGSTGKPKGVVVEHAALCSSINGHGKDYGLGQDSRVLQFSNYVFDVSLGEIFSTLALGGTVCVPSDEQRLAGITEFMEDAGVNTAMLTPSFVRTFTPSQLPSLKTLVVGGEAPAKDTIQNWYGNVKLINGYGPAEACIYCSTHVFDSPDANPTTIGRGANNAHWIVNPENVNELTPIGCIGELLVQGYTLARGYINETALTEKSFVESVEWLDAKSGPKFYRTGDLVRYNVDGTLEYLGRRDTQVKIRGQRMELSEIEYAVKEAQPEVEHVAADVVKFESRESLLGFISFNDKSIGSQEDDSSDILSIDDNMRSKLVNLVDSLKALLPSYMIPSVFIPMRKMPFVSAMKLDRKQLRNLAKELSADDIAGFSLGSREKIAPETEMEFKMRDIWAKVLELDPEEISKNDSFLEIGGDSITAIRLVTACKQEDVGITMADIFADSQLSTLSSKATVGVSQETYEVEPFGLLPSDEVEDIRAEVYSQTKLSLEQHTFEDIMPCTTSQEGFLATKEKVPTSLISKRLYELPDNIDLDKFKEAWEKTLEVCGSLRTRIIKHNGTALQAIVKGDIEWEDTSDHTVRSYMDSIKNTTMGYGTRLCRYATIQEEGKNYFVWFLSHGKYILNVLLFLFVHQY